MLAQERKTEGLGSGVVAEKRGLAGEFRWSRNECERPASRERLKVPGNLGAEFRILDDLPQEPWSASSRGRGWGTQLIKLME